MLYIVPKTTLSNQSEGHTHKVDQNPKNNPSFKKQFLSNFHELSPNLFSFYAQDARYDLRCSFVLAIQDTLICDLSEQSNEEYLIPMAMSDWPILEAQKLPEKAFGNEYIQEMLTARFYLNMLESLLVFCQATNANGLALTVDDSNLDALEIYRNFIFHESRIPTLSEEKIQIRISADHDTHQELVKHLQKVNQDFRQTLWRNQWGNPALRAYLKYFALSDF
ncbi:MAG: hypothetical protein FJX03_02475 [Alphaproteobacteria bacterium]|nr:hypothetical protein [Alphaproteobacteria bacterium]